MEALENNIQKVEELFNAQKSFLLKAKKTMIFLGAIGVLYVHIKLLGAQRKYHYPDWEIYLGDIIVAILVFSSIVFIPLYQFFADRIMQRITWSIKSSIIKNVLNNYTNDFHLSFKGILPDEDIKDLELQSGILQFCYGDDLIFGKINSTRFRISELHSVSPLGRNFDGIVGVLLFKSDIENQDVEKINRFMDEMDKGNKIKIVIKKRKLFLMLKGRKKHFEFRIKKNQVNKDDLTKDFVDFNMLLIALHKFSQPDFFN